MGRVVVDNGAELELLTNLATARQQPVNLWLLLTPDVAVETHHHYTVTGTGDSKFGIPVAEAKAVAKRLVAGTTLASPLRLTGLHLHLGSNFHNTEPMVTAIECLLDLTKFLRENYRWELQELCPGGGWGVRYHPDDPAMPVEPFVAGIVKAVVAGCRQRALPLPELILEPGRSLIAQAGVALNTVGARKVINGVRTYFSVDGGLADNPRPALYNTNSTAVLANRADEADLETMAIGGPYCESGDILIDAIDLPVAKPGDILAVPVAGAYQLSMASNYNAGPRSAVVFIEEATVKLVQRRETLDDLVGRDVDS